MARVKIRRGTAAQAAAATLRQDELFFASDTHALYVEIDGVNTAIVGAQGSQGNQGNAGSQGTQGTQGNAGSQGPQGFQGTAG